MEIEKGNTRIKNSLEQGIMRLVKKEQSCHEIGCRLNLLMRNTQIPNSSNEYLLTERVSSALYEVISRNDNATLTLQLECPK